MYRYSILTPSNEGGAANEAHHDGSDCSLVSDG